MTNSTENKNNTSTKQQQTKSFKKNGPLRTGAIVPSIILLVVFWGYFKFFLDHNLRSLMEWTGTLINGAQVDVGYVKTSFIKGSFELGYLQVTDKNQPQRNILQVNKVHFQFLWDALLRAKFVIADASITNIQTMTPRKHPGKVLPPSPPKKESGPGIVEDVQTSIMKQAESQFSKNILGDAAHLLEGSDPSDYLKKIEGELKTSAQIKVLEATLKEKEKIWQERIKKLPKKEELEALGQKAKQLKFDTKNPVEFAKSIKEADKLLKEADQTLRTVSETGKNLNSDIELYSKSFKDLDRLIQEDLNDIKSRLKLPKIDAADFSKSIFLHLFAQKLAGVWKYVALAKQYMPPAKTTKKGETTSAADETFVPPKRGQGKTYRFPLAKGYPLFLLKHAGISSSFTESQTGESNYSGNISGEIKNFTSDPELLGLPATMQIKGNFPGQGIQGLDLFAQFDHTKIPAKETLKIKVESYPVTRQSFSESTDLNFTMEQAIGQFHLFAEIVDGNVQVQLNNSFQKIKYLIAAKNKILQEILTNIINGIPVINVNAQASGPWTQLNFNLNSNLGDELSRGLKQQFQAKLDEANVRIKKLIDSVVGNQKEKLNANFSKIKDQMTGELNKSKNDLEKAQKDLQKNAKSTEKNNGLKNLEQQGKDLLKKFKFGG